MILCLDLETSGLNEQRCGILQIGATWLHDGDSFFRDCHVLTGADVEQGALAVNGLTEERARDPHTIPESMALIEFLGWVKGAIPHGQRVQLAAWNAHFDHRFLCAGLDRAHVKETYRPFHHRLIDCHSALAVDLMRETLSEQIGMPDVRLIAHRFGDEVKNSDSAAELLNLPAEPKPHNALNGAKQVRAMLRRILGDTGALP